jgi:hypothetical protein
MSTRPVSNMWLLQKECTYAHPVQEIRSNKKTLHVWTTGKWDPMIAISHSLPTAITRASYSSKGSSNIRSPGRHLDKETLPGYRSYRETSRDEVWFRNKPYTNDMHLQRARAFPRARPALLSARRKMKVSWGNFVVRAGRVSAGSWFVAG